MGWGTCGPYMRAPREGGSFSLALSLFMYHSQYSEYITSLLIHFWSAALVYADGDSPWVGYNSYLSFTCSALQDPEGGLGYKVLKFS